MDVRLTAAVVLLGLAACNGAGDAADSSARGPGSDPPTESAARAVQETQTARVLSELPEACTLLGADDVEAALDEAVSGEQVAHAPKQMSACRFTASDGDRLTVQVLFITLDAYDPSGDSPDKLRAQVAQSSGEPDGELNGDGYHGFYVESSEATGAHVVTEFQGTAMLSDRPVSQLHMTVELSSGEEPADRLDAVRSTVESVIDRL